VTEGHSQAHTGTWVISQPVRRALARAVLDLRTALEEDFGKQLRALGIREDGEQRPAGRTLTPAEQHVRSVASAVICREVAGGATKEQAFKAYVRDSAFTFLNRMVGLRCLEERGLLLVDGQPETAVKVDPARNASSLYWRVRNELGPGTPPREVWRETLRRAGAAISEQVRVLFDPESEYAALLPLQPTLQRVVDALNAPEIPSETYVQDELLGWVYQYYNASEKDAAYARLAQGKKLERPEELVAATCLYTERYMVDYLLQNTLGALWLEMHPDSTLPERWPYFVRPAEGAPQPQGAPRPLREITVMDTGCGSGHFLVRAFDLLVEMYREEGREPEREIPQLIIERNLHGIDIDLRAVQIAALALYLKGCALAGPGFRPRRLNLVAADALLPGDEPPAEYLASLRGDREAVAVVKGIWQGLKHVREFGSLLHPERAVDEAIRRQREEDRRRYPMLQRNDAHWEQWKRELLRGLQEEFERQARSEDLGQRLFGEEAAKGVSLVEALGRKYDVVVMNPPYAGSKNLSPRLKAFVEREYKEGKRDLYAAFIQRCRDFARRDGYVGMVTQQSWLFLHSYATLRKDVLERTTVATLAHLGPRAFEEIGGEVVNIALFTLRNAAPDAQHHLVAFRLIGPKSPAEKDRLLKLAVSSRAEKAISRTRQSDFSAIPNSPLVYWLRRRFFELLINEQRLSQVADVRQGLATADNERFVRYFWEVDRIEGADEPRTGRWFWFAKGGRYQKWAGFENLVVDWERDGERIKQHIVDQYPYLNGNWSWVAKNTSYYFSPGLTYTQIASGSLGVRLLETSIFSHASNSIFPKDLPSEALAALLNSRPATYIARAIAQKIGFEAGHVAQIPITRGSLDAFERVGQICTALKLAIVGQDLLERRFMRVASEMGFADSLTDRIGRDRPDTVLLLALEGVAERTACDFYGLNSADIQSVLEETGSPAGWYPLLSGYDRIDGLSRRN
jgi:hypothetical protein